MDENLWYGYLHVNGTVQVKRWFPTTGHLDLEEALESPFVQKVHGPVPADNRKQALEIFTEKLKSESE